MKITIIGLGIIGASYAKGLIKKGYEVYGVDTNPETIEYALENGFIVKGSATGEELIPNSDVVILGLYPEKIVPYIEGNLHFFKEGQVVTDVCGIKEMICDKCSKLLTKAYFVGSHPMAGKEKVGIKYADEKIFKDANFLLCPLEDTNPIAVSTVKEIANALEFGHIYEITPKFHDEMIAYTSQLTHAIAVSLVNSKTNDEAFKFVGDSYRDLTRIAMINEKLWSELFLDNKEALIKQIDLFTNELEELKDAIRNGNSNVLKEKFISSKKKREVM